MKNSKLKVGLTSVITITVFIALVMYVVNVLTDPEIGYYPGAGMEPYFYKFNDEGKFVIDWTYSGPYTVLLGIAFLAWATKLCRFTIPSAKSKKGNSALAMPIDLLLGVGIMIAIISLFLPINYMAEDIAAGEPTRMVASRIIGFVGTPLAFITSIGAVGLSK